MKRIDPERVAALVAEAVGATDGPQLFHDCVAVQILEAGHAGDLDTAAELAEPLLESVRRILTNRANRAMSDGESCSLEMYGSGREYIRGASSIDPSLEVGSQKVRARRAHVSSVKRALTSLKPPEFERACTEILRIMGCVEPRTSPISDDGGIDFYGKLELKGRLDNSHAHGGIDNRVGLWLIGQAKHYPTRPIQTAHIRELVGSIELARTGGAIHDWAGLNLRPFDSVVHLFFTTGHYSSGSRLLLNNSGMVSMGGDQLATLLADAGVGIDPSSLTFSGSQFRSELSL